MHLFRRPQFSSLRAQLLLSMAVPIIVLLIALALVGFLA